MEKVFDSVLKTIGKTPMVQLDRLKAAWKLEGTLLAVLILGPAVCLAVVFDMESGSAADWVAALATVAAFIAAVAAARYAKGTLDREEGRDERWIREQETEQA
ncbi:MAG: hypothetical protein KBH34_01200, partial [Acetomicrobium sp.]|nr:hypothetical protein [Acetomicrobium sp.]